MGGHAEQVGVVGESYLVQDDDAGLRELELVVVEPPGQAGKGSRLGAIPASLPNVRAAWPDVAVPSTW